MENNIQKQIYDLKKIVEQQNIRIVLLENRINLNICLSNLCFNCKIPCFQINNCKKCNKKICNLCSIKKDSMFDDKGYSCDIDMYCSNECFN
jgi:hypothetical protein